MRVLVVDDSAFMRKALSQMIASDPRMQVVGTARDGQEGVEMAEALKPDVITMDIEMPRMDGLTALRHIMRRSPTPVLMVSALTPQGSQAALRAMTIGAADVLAKDLSQASLSIEHLQEDLLNRLRAIGRRHRPAAPAAESSAAIHRAEPVEAPPVYRPGRFDVVCIGSSTGGPPVLEAILTSLPATMRTPIVVAQHMPRLFTQSMAQRLAQVCAMPVHHAHDGMPLEAGCIHIAPGDGHIHLRKTGLGQWALVVNQEPAGEPYRPSVNALLASAAREVGRRTLAIILTGIGEDGLVGSQAVHDRGGVILAQSQETCVVYGMPKAVTQRGLTAANLSPSQIAQVLTSLARA